MKNGLNTYSKLLNFLSINVKAKLYNVFLKGLSHLFFKL